MAELRAPEQNRLLGQLANMLRATEGDIAAPEFLPRGLDVMGLVRQLMLPSAETVEKLSYGDPLFRMPTQSNIPITADREYLAEVLGMAPAVPAASRATTRLSNEAADQLVRAITRNPEATAPQVLEAAGQMLPMSRITTYHGSPYLFRQFDPARVGTGEGAQAYGVGAGYTAEARPVAEEYARILANRDVTNQNRLTPHANAKRLVDLAGDPQYAADDIRFVLESDPNHPQKELLSDTLNYIESGRYAEPLQTPGYIYKGEIPDEILPSFLDWDKKFADQTPQVKEAIKKYWDDNNVFGDPTKLSGEGIYDSIVAHVYSDVGRFQSQKAASEELEKAGVLGIRYFDEKSRGSYKAQLTYKGQPYSDVVEFKTKQQLDDYIKESNEKGFGVQTFPQTSNFVTFRPEDYRIQEINDIPIEQYMEQGLL